MKEKERYYQHNQLQFCSVPDFAYFNFVRNL